MKKKIILILTVGISFAPAAFAGQLKGSSTDGSAIRCSLSQQDKKLVEDSDSHQKKDKAVGIATETSTR
ncbi:MAG: hypothetical protein A3K03_05275 [Bdellovibrionales bacterium RIFOXYD1_FULL_44_7]|nr:MAG: hypothetical protein A3K03_05275 [Bdellovibrionales bacterium RIFOXYD1_FULL_44_7]